jgi:hypothetical protein
MGLESANYMYVTNNASKDLLVNLLTEIPGTHLKSSMNDKFLYLEQVKDGFLIDFQVFPQAEGSALKLSMRIALCNPNNVLEALTECFKVLISKFGGKIFDLETDKSFLSLTDDSIQQIREGFFQKKAKFQQWHGDFTAGISGDKVFEYMRKMKESN